MDFFLHGISKIFGKFKTNSIRIKAWADRDRRSSFSQKIAVRSAIAKSMIGIAKNAIFLAIFCWFGPVQVLGSFVSTIFEISGWAIYGFSNIWVAYFRLSYIFGSKSCFCCLRLCLWLQNTMHRKNMNLPYSIHMYRVENRIFPVEFSCISAGSFCKSFFKNIVFYLNGRLSKIRSVHNYGVR